MVEVFSSMPATHFEWSGHDVCASQFRKSRLRTTISVPVVGLLAHAARRWAQSIVLSHDFKIRHERIKTRFQ